MAYKSTEIQLELRKFVSTEYVLASIPDSWQATIVRN